MRSVIVLIFFLVLALTTICCSQSNSKKSIEDQLIYSDSLSKNNAKVKLLSLSPDAQVKLKNFTDYQNLHNFMITLSNANPYYLKKYRDSLDILLFNFKENMAEEQLFVKPIRSRITVLTTRSRLLAEAVDEDNSLEEKVLDQNKKLLEAYNSLIIQLNELSLSIPSIIEQELLKNTIIKKDTIQNEEM